ncbi:hypothetical protein B0O80DRAFT_434278 [Mortierella sp. GBAus27b]|nr:hypothetical protein B0O80DRAFT_434278 [Mortierella sp. GBAus27b]
MESVNSVSNGSYSSSASSHYSRNYPYSSSTHSHSHPNHGSHSSIDSGLPDGHGAGVGGGHDGMLNNGRADPNSAVYSTSAPSPSTTHSLVGGRPKRRSEMFTHQESPYFEPTQQHYSLYSSDQSISYNLKISAKIDRGFFLAANDWTCYRRNYFQISASFAVLGLDPSLHTEVPCLLDKGGELVTVRAFLVCIGAQIQHGEKVIELVQHTPKRDKGPQITPRPTLIRAGGDLSLGSSGSNPFVVTFERVQFKTATANNGKRRAAQQYYQVHVDLFAELENGDTVLVASSFSAPLVVRGRSPGHYADTDDTPVDGVHGVDTRYHYRNDSISSAGGGPLGSPVSSSEYSYYSGYGYGSSSYPYQSLGSASHIAAQSHEAGYYDRKDPDSYPASPLSAGPHPSESATPEMYSSSAFAGSDSPSTYSRISQLSSHQSYNGGAYTHYSPYGGQPHHDMYRDQDHEAQMAGLRIHSPSSPKSLSVAGSPAATPRRQSFSSTMISRQQERGVGGTTTRKSRSISLSGTTTTTTVNKLSMSKVRPTTRTIPAPPTRDMLLKGAGHGYSKDRIPESLMEEQQL